MRSGHMEGKRAGAIALLMLLIMTAIAVAAADEQPRDPAYKEGWILTFEDEFDGDTIDTSKWNVLPVGVPYAPRRDGYWTQNQAFLDGEGHLIIQIDQVNGAYHSGAVNTQGKFEQAYGYYEIRAQLPKEQGFWTAFWLMTDGVRKVGNGGRDGTEIDIFESPYSQSDRIHHALHWDGYDVDHKSAGVDVYIPGIYQGFHTFALEWNEDEYIFYVDGRETWRTSAGGVSQVPSYLKITAEVGSWGGDIRKANLPAQLIVDYVRVYTRDHKIEIASPGRDATVPANAPVRFQVDPAVAIAEVQVLQNDVEIYRGTAVPGDLALSLPIHERTEEHRLTVRVTDEDRKVYERSTRFRVEQLSLITSADARGWTRGVLEVQAAAGFGPGEGIATAELLLKPVGEHEKQDVVELYRGSNLPAVTVDTLQLADGAYDLVLTVNTDQGRTVEAVQRIVVDNWNELEEAFAPPVVFFGTSIDSLLAVDRSPGWLSLSDSPDAFFGDGGRLAARGDGEHYLVWELPRLRSLGLVLYVRTAHDAQQVHFEASGTNGWRPVAAEIAATDESSDGWHRVVLIGSIPADWNADKFRLVLPASVADPDRLQLGSLTLKGLSEER